MLLAPLQADRSMRATGYVVLQMASTRRGSSELKRRRSGEPFAPSLPVTALSDCARRNPSEISSWPALFMNASAAIADPWLRSSSLVVREA
jgi:hypothetical protein